ncbi:MAG TPA: DNA polymerase IV [Anaerolineales bacterium]|nr:DNA polymerase IV [Anaerolineales bacterium]
MSRTILHVDLDAFFCSVEEKLNPELRGKAFVVGGTPQGRGVVASASYAARPFGVRSAMPTARALRLCPHLIVVPGRHGVYGEESERVMDILRDAAPVVEQISVDEAFLDVSDDPRPGEQVARALREEIRKRCELPTSWGVAGSKLVAKIATEVGKPNGLIVVPRGGEAAFLAPLPVEMLWGVGPRTREQLVGLGLRTVGDLASQTPAWLSTHLGPHGIELAARARGEDDRPVEEGREARSMSNETTFARDVADPAELLRTLRALSDNVGSRLREAGLAGTTVRLKLRWPDFTTLTRQTRLPQPTDQDREIFAAAQGLFERVWKKGRAVRLIGVGVAHLGERLRQLSLFDAAWQHDERLLAAVDAIRTRYGYDALRRGHEVDTPERGRTHEPEG